MIDRRRFLRTTALASAGTLAGAAAARAFGFEEPTASVSGEYQAARLACVAGDASHAQLLAELRGRLDGLALSDEQKQQVLDQATCPLCGCRISST